jgi:rRNA processing protein Gar1
VPTVRAGAVVTVPAGGGVSQLAAVNQALSLVGTIATVLGSVITSYVLVRNLSR